ncbi:hypothetical protein TNCV_1163331 [Trichonephila clavipes]|nr:hypothetical protein TNCV_1163331 [Trichonephila clavipes]
MSLTTSMELFFKSGKEKSQIILSPVECSKLLSRYAKDSRASLRRDEFRGPQSDNVRQVEYSTTTWLSEVGET